MAEKVLQFDEKALLGELNNIERVLLPRASYTSLNRAAQLYPIGSAAYLPIIAWVFMTLGIIVGDSVDRFPMDPGITY